MAEYPIVIVDDDVWMQRILSKVLEGFGFRTYIATNGFDGVALALEHQPVVVFLDIMMPELSGHLTLKMLKRLKQTRNIPVVMISALSDTENLGLAVKTGAVGFISKPFTRATIFDKLKHILGTEYLNEITQRSQMSEQELREVQAQQGAQEDKQGEEAQSAAADAAAMRPPDRTPNDPSTASEASKRYSRESKRQQQIDVIKELLLKKDDGDS